MSFIDNIIRPEIRALEPYHVPDSAGCLKLDAMENPYSLPDALRQELGKRLSGAALNRYPVPSYTALKAALCEKFAVPDGYDVIVGNGSDELITLIATAVARKDRPAKIMAPIPAFVMYAMTAGFAGMEFVGVPLKPDFSLDRQAMLDAIQKHRPSVLYLAYPNNPTGNRFDTDDMFAIIEAMKDIGLVISDEAYQPFAQTSMMPHLPQHPNLAVMRTVSKLGLAGIRLGCLSAHPVLLEELEKVRMPYNVNVLTETAALFALEHIEVFLKQADTIRRERETLSRELAALPGVTVFPSAANFLLIRLKNADTVFEKLLEEKILIKNPGKMHPLLENCLRITVGTPEENRRFIQTFTACLR
ncbi:MAG: histidinol-phosphate transaminase [Oxalobacter formigenes]|nr:histidinol-phosphate transaminase [Oxalobacter formigenes]